MQPSSKFFSINHLITILGTSFETIKYFNLLYDPYFQELLNKDLRSITNWKESDQFFSEHARFIQGYHISNLILGTKAWITLLDIIQCINKKKFEEIHKGTPYYFSAIFYLAMEKHEEGLELMDFGLSQDFKIHNRTNIKEAPGWKYLTLYPTGGNDQGQAKLLNETLLNFIDVLSKFSIISSIEELRGIAVRKILYKRERARRSAWAMLISQILDFEQNKQILRIAPLDLENQIKAHLSLVKMSLILETFLKKSVKSKNTSFQKRRRTFRVYSHPSLTLGDIYTALNIQCNNTPSQLVGFNYKKLGRWITNGSNNIPLGFSIAKLIRNNVNHTFQDSSISEALYEKIFAIIFNVQLESLKIFY